MKRFYYFLKENPKYPEVIVAKDKNEVVSLLISDMGEHARDQILNILSEEEFTGKPAKPINQMQQLPNNSGCGPESFLNMIPTEQAENKIHQKDEPVTQQPVQNKPTHDVKIFEVNGELFKLENGQLFKKIWKEVDDQNNFRIIKSDTNKPLKSDKYKIETLVWDIVD